MERNGKDWVFCLTSVTGVLPQRHRAAMGKVVFGQDVLSSMEDLFCGRTSHMIHKKQCVLCFYSPLMHTIDVVRGAGEGGACPCATGCDGRVAAGKDTTCGQCTSVCSEESTSTACCSCGEDEMDALFVCATCGFGGCRAHATLHSSKNDEAHSRFFGVRICLTTKVTDAPAQGSAADGSGGEPPVLRIDASSDNEFDTTTAYGLGAWVKEEGDFVAAFGPCAVQRVFGVKSLAHIIPHFVAATDKSSAEVATVAWEATLQECEHIKGLVPSVVYGYDEDDVRCMAADCTKVDNLWLCLTCGYLGCGRKHADGQGGNEHAIHHAARSGHNVVVKTGSLDPVRRIGDVHCYGCDDDIRDSALEAHLRIFGIELSKCTKTEQSLAEANYALNQSFDFSIGAGGDALLCPVAGQGATGLKNIGNSCYFASVMQVLFSVPEVARIFGVPGEWLTKPLCTMIESRSRLCSGRKFSGDVDENVGMKHMLECAAQDQSECIMCQVIKLGQGIWCGHYANQWAVGHALKKEGSKGSDGADGAESGELSVREKLMRMAYYWAPEPRDAKVLMAYGHSDFISSNQQDAVLYLDHAVEMLERVGATLLGKPSGGVSKLLSVPMVTSRKCSACGNTQVEESVARYIRLTAPGLTDDYGNATNPLHVGRVEEGDTAEGEGAKSPEPVDIPLQLCMSQFVADGVVENVLCDACNARTDFVAKTGVAGGFPEYVAVAITRCVLYKWQEAKLNVNIQFDAGTPLDLSPLLHPDTDSLREIASPPSGSSSAPSDSTGEEAVISAVSTPVDPASIGVDDMFDESMVESLMAMDFSRNAVVRALRRTSGDPNAAVQWIFDNFGDGSVNRPLTPPGGVHTASTASSSRSATSLVSDDNIVMLCGLGIHENLARKALYMCNDTVSIAANWAFEHGSDPGMSAEELEQVGKGNASTAGADASGGLANGNVHEVDVVSGAQSGDSRYELCAMIHHRGARATAGHYVATARSMVDGQERWVLFNDDKVVAVPEPLFGSASLYLLRKKR